MNIFDSKQKEFPAVTDENNTETYGVKCPRCGNICRTGAIYCEKCGTRIQMIPRKNCDTVITREMPQINIS